MGRIDGKKVPDCLVFYVEDNVQKWVMANKDDRNDVLLSLLQKPNVDNASIFIIKRVSIMSSAIWLDEKHHPSGYFDLYDFYKEFDRPQTT